MAYSLMTLPNELVAFIWSLLPIDEAAQGRMICRRICSLMDQSEIFWNSFLHLALKHRMMSRIDAAGKLRCTEVYHEVRFLFGAHRYLVALEFHLIYTLLQGALELVGDSLKPATPFFTKEYSMNPNLLAIRSESSSVGYRRGISLTKQFMCNLMQIIQGYHTRDDIFPDSEAIAGNEALPGLFSYINAIFCSVLLAPPVDHPTVFDCPWCNEALYANKRFALDVWASLRVRVLFVSPMHDEPIVTAQKELASQDLQQNVTEKKMWLECRRCGTIGACSPICLQCSFVLLYSQYSCFIPSYLSTRPILDFLGRMW